MELLPPLREDLQLFQGPPLGDGSPTWTLQDPVRNLFFRLGRQEFEILARWALGRGADLVAAIRRETTLEVTAAEIDALAKFLQRNQLMSPEDPDSRSLLRARSAQRPPGALKWLISHYLFIRIPLFHPDAFLTATLPAVRLLMTRSFLVLLALAGGLGLFLTLRQWEAFTHSFVHFFTLQGLVYYGVAVFLAKVVHELGHAYTAKQYGVRVPTMGVAFLVFFPMLYTDTSESWKVRDRGGRMAIVSAGLLSELALAVLAILLWHFLPEGPAKSACFLVGTVTWATSLALNLSPFMRFDGYYLLSDILDVPNLHDRSFALGRWALAKTLLGIDPGCPEQMPLGKQRFLILFAYATWVYRLLLFTAIALLVYHLFFKALGLVLFAVEMVWFIGLPLWRVAKNAWRRRGILRWNLRLAIFLMLVPAGLFSVFVPLRLPVFVPSLLQSGALTGLYPPFAARVEEIRVAEGQAVEKGEVLFVLVAPELDYEETLALGEVRMLEAQLRRQFNQYGLMETMRVVEQRLSTAMTRLEGFRTQKARLEITAPRAGQVVDLAQDLHTGRWIRPTLRLASLIDRSGMVLEGYVGEAELAGVRRGQAARFYPEAPGFPLVDCRVRYVESASTRVLDAPDLTSLYKGPIPVTPPQDGRTHWQVRETVYRVGFEPVEPPGKPGHTVRGTVRLRGESLSIASRFLIRVRAVLIRESGF